MAEQAGREREDHRLAAGHSVGLGEQRPHAGGALLGRGVEVGEPLGEKRARLPEAHLADHLGRDLPREGAPRDRLESPHRRERVRLARSGRGVEVEPHRLVQAIGLLGLRGVLLGEHGAGPGKKWVGVEGAPE